jgi:hypothetical protein
MIIKPEQALQITICEWVLWNTDLPFIHIPNERKCSDAQREILRRMGLRAGASDIFIPRANKTHHGLFMELKVGRNKPTPYQLKFIEDMLKENYYACVCYGFEESIIVIKEFYNFTPDTRTIF